MAHSNICDPAGDLVLKVGSGDEMTRIRVHSKVLSLASPVFAAMLSPRFAEGQALENNKGMVDSTTTIDLPDDDPLAMNLICYTLHFKEDAAQRISLSPETLMGLAVICDKYNMSRALRPWSHIWMETCIREDQCDYDESDTARISYGLEHHESFWRSTRDIIRHSTLVQLDTNYSLLPDNVIGSLRIHCKNFLDQLQSDVESLVKPLLECDCHAEEYQGGVQSCEHHIMLGDYIKCLYCSGLWPISNIQIHSIFWASGMLQDFEKHPAGQHKMETLLGKAVHDVDSRVTGLCLSCVRNGTYSEGGVECHAELECDFLAKTEHEID